MIGHGKNKSGTRRFICKHCRATSTRSIDTKARDLQAFLDWLLSRQSQKTMPGAGRTFRRRNQQFWEYWPLPSLVDQIHDVVFVDGIHLGRRAVVLIASSREHVLGWYLARYEHATAWQALLDKIAPPIMVVCDGGSGFAKACKRSWPTTRVQRCVFHAFAQVRRYTTSRPKLQAGIELYALALDLLHLDNTEQAHQWVNRYHQWCDRWRNFLAEKTRLPSGALSDTHRNLVKARASLNTLIRANTLFTYLDSELAQYQPLPATNNRAESLNAQLRQLLRDHRGLSLTRRIKTIMWWCYTHTENPLPPAEILHIMPTDQEIENIINTQTKPDPHLPGTPNWGTAIQWHELHHPTHYQTNWN